MAIPRRIQLTTMDTTLFDPQSTVPLRMGLLTASIGVLCAFWAVYTLRKLHGRAFSWKSPMVMQFLGWSIFTIEMTMLSFATGSYLQCERPYVQLIPSLLVGRCPYSILHRVAKILNTLGTSLLVVSVMLRFQPAYAAFRPQLVNRMHRAVYVFLAAYTVATVGVLAVGAKFRDTLTIDPRSSNTTIEIVERHVSLLWSIILFSVNVISAVQGMRFVLNKIQECRAELSPPRLFGKSLQTHPKGYLRLTYFFLFLNGTMALLYLAFKLNWVPFYQGYPYIIRTTVNNVIVKVTNMCMMLAMNTLGKAVSKGYRSFENSRSPRHRFPYSPSSAAESGASPKAAPLSPPPKTLAPIRIPPPSPHGTLINGTSRIAKRKGMA
jgi:hypothetical protein